MIVFRLQFPNGEGAYHSRWDWPAGDRPRFLRGMYRQRANGEDPHPAPCEDGIDRVAPQEFFGFSQAQQLLDWFFRDGPEDARRYRSRSMFITVWDVRRRFVREGGKQCVFLKHAAQMVGRWDPQEFLDHFQPSKGVLSPGAWSKIIT